MDYIVIAVIIVVLIIVISIISISNKINKAIVKIDEASSGIDVALTKRYDVLTKMIDVVKSYAKHEKDTLFEVVKLRKNMSIEEKNAENKKMDENFSKINIVAENYPELKSSENYKTLQQSIVEVEEHLQAARRLYNSNVSIYNQMIVSFPISIIAKSKGMVKKDFFEADETKKEDVKIKLD
ncbi:MAG: LemA family protein [Tenericutes bacterium]|nr:LemA family protein [Mycoplasmatota bacterium]